MPFKSRWGPHRSALISCASSLCQERLNQVEAKLAEVREGKAMEYLNPLAELQENMRIHTQVAGK